MFIRFAVDPKAKAGARAPEMCPETPEIEGLGDNEPLSEKFRNLAPKEFMITTNTFLFKFHGNRPPGSG